MKNTVRHARGVGAALLVSALGWGLAAQAASFYEEQGQLVRASKAVSALGPNLFGDKVNHYNGALEFVQSDLSLPGSSALPVSVARRVAGTPNARLMGGHFGGWDLEIPRVQGTFSRKSGWSAGMGNGLNRCSAFAGPGTVLGTNLQGYFDQEEYWRGHMLYDPDTGEQEILQRTANSAPVPTDGKAYPLTTKSRWAIGCVPLKTSNAFYQGSRDNQGEGFLALRPDGVSFRFDWLVRRPADTLYRSNEMPSTGTAAAARKRALGGPDRRPTEMVGFSLQRDEVWILPTESRDRNGNTVSYVYDDAKPWRLLKMVGSDGRTLTFTYDGDSNRISSVTDGKRVIRYAYAADYSLASVTYADGSQMTMSSSLPLGQGTRYAKPPGCDTQDPGTVQPDAGQLTFNHPSGARGVFAIQTTLHARSFVPQSCFAGSQYPPVLEFTRFPLYFGARSLMKKEISGSTVGLPVQSWTYSYSDPTGQASWSTCTGNCVGTKTVQIVSNTGRVQTQTYGTHVDVDEGKLLSAAEGTSTSPVMRYTTHEYRTGAIVGQSLLAMGDSTTAVRNDPLKRKQIAQDGSSFTWDATVFDAQWDRPTTIVRTGPGGTRTEVTSYVDKLTPYVTGLVGTVTVTSVSGQPVMQSHQYDSLGRLLSTSKFGVLQFKQDYNADGTLAWKEDGAAHRTQYFDYQLGLPQRIQYADGSVERASVDAQGFVRSVTSPVNSSYITYYDYDDAGRLSLVTPPGGYSATSLKFEPVASSEYGLGAGHWRQTISKGNARTVTYFDAFWRPVMVRTFDVGDEANTRKVVVKGYDADNLPSYESYPARELTDVSVRDKGKRMRYDALGRLTAQEQDTELGVQTSSTSYLSGFKTQLTNPRGKVTTQTLWALDNPSESQLASSAAPEGVSLQIQRDALGKPTSITRSGGGNSVTRRYVYDGGQRLCKTIEPEVGSTVQAYDAAGNVAWRAPGQALPDASACNTGNVAAASVITYGYDAVNQLISTSYGDNSAAVTRTYWEDGKPKTVVSNGTTWTYDYNALRLLTRETLNFGGQAFVFDRSYNPSGDLSSLTYPTGGPAISYLPNALGEPAQIGSYADTVRFHPNGSVAGYKLGNGIVHSTTLNARGLPETNEDVGVIKDRYTYDANGNVAGIEDQQEGGKTSRTMSYDGLDRLLSTSAPQLWGNASYTYDALDNLRTANVGSRLATLNYTDGSNRLNSITVNGSTSSYSYDAYGNITSKGAQTFGFDLGNRLSSSSLGGQYVYDGLGRRVQFITKDNSKRLYVYSQAGQLLWSTQVGTVPATSTTTCAPGYSWNGSQCLATTTTPATLKPTCPDGYTLSGDQCVKTTVDTVPALTRPKCPDGYTLSAGQCLGSVSYPATATPTCTAPYTYDSGSRQCLWTHVTSTQAPTYTYSCNSGYTLKGSTCYATKAPGTEYYCADPSYTVNGAYCEKAILKSDPATPVYTCSNGATPDASHMCTVSTESPATVVNTCPPTYTFDGSKCNGYQMQAPSMTLDCKGKGTPTAWSGQSSTGYYCFISNVAVDINSPEPEPLCQSQADQAGLRLEEVKAVVGSMKKYQCVIGPQPTFACPTGFMPSGDTCAKPVSQAPTVSYTCSAGTLTASNTCKVTSTVAANKAYTCDSGKTLKVDRCEYTVVDRVSVLQRPKCDSGYALEGGQCVATSGVPAISAPSCNSGYTLESGQCKLYVTDRATPGTSYGCPEGGTLSSSTCTRSDTKAPTSEYYCADVSYTLSGSQCSKTTVLKTTPTSAYGCAANAVLEAGNVCRAIGTGTISYTCGSGTLSGSNCLGANQGTAYIHLGGKLIAETVVGGTTQYVHTDALGSPVARTGAAKEVISRTRYEPYGYVAAGTKPSASNSQIGFTGHVQDAETELVYMQQRYYDPVAGRFLSVDPVVTDANTGKGFGLYTYVDNNPYTKIDPDGREPEMHSWADPKGMTHKEATVGLNMVGGLAAEFLPGASSVQALSEGQPVLAIAMAVVDVSGGKVAAVATKYSRKLYGFASNSKLAKSIREAAAGKSCPKCGKEMVPGTKTAPQVQHEPSLSEVHYEHGGDKMSSTEKKAYANSEESVNGANCQECQRKEGGQQRAYVAEQEKANGR